MSRLLKIKLILNKRNKSTTLQVPKKEFDKVIRQKINNSKFAFVKFEDWE
jgi:hypothetical protein